MVFGVIRATFSNDASMNYKYPVKWVEFHKLLLSIVLVFSIMGAAAQTAMLPNAFSHNDYRRKRPLQDALNHGFRYVEADVYLRKGKLIVAHILPCLKKNRTLEGLYLQPLLDYVERRDQPQNLIDTPITLMIDIKSDADQTYHALLELLEKYKPILSHYDSTGTIPGKVTIVVTGNKPAKLISDKNSGYVFMDDNLRQITPYNFSELYPIASCKYSRLLKWKGKGAISPEDKRRLKFYVAEAHKRGRKVRLWASPENKMVWNELLACKVDLINTDRLSSLRRFLTATTAKIFPAPPVAETPHLAPMAQLVAGPGSASGIIAINYVEPITIAEDVEIDTILDTPAPVN